MVKKKSRHRRKRTGSNLTKPDELLLTYMNYISEQNYEEMYQMLDVDASGQISEEDFIKRNSAIYEGIEVYNMTTTIISYDNNDFIMGLSSEKWAALKIGAEEMKDSLLRLGFQEELPFLRQKEQRKIRF